MHRILKSGTADAANPVMAVGEFKKFSNVIGGTASDVETASPEDVLHLVGDLIDSYEGKSVRQFEGVCKRQGYLEDTCGCAQDRFEATYMPMAKEFMRVLRDTRRFPERHEP